MKARALKELISAIPDDADVLVLGMDGYDTAWQIGVEVIQPGEGPPSYSEMYLLQGIEENS